MLPELKSDDTVLCSDMAEFALPLYPRIASDIVDDEPFLWKYVHLSIGAAPNPCFMSATGDALFQSEEKVVFEDLISTEVNTHRRPDDKVRHYIFATAVGSRHSDPPGWWCT